MVGRAYCCIEDRQTIHCSDVTEGFSRYTHDPYIKYVLTLLSSEQLDIGLKANLLLLLLLLFLFSHVLGGVIKLLYALFFFCSKTLQCFSSGGIVYEEGSVEASVAGTGGPGTMGVGCSVWGWGGGITLPTRLPLPSSDTIVTQVAVGRTQKAAATKNGRLFVWEVNNKPMDWFKHILFRYKAHRKGLGAA